MSYNERETARSRNHPMFHSTACLEATVDAFCEDAPDPGCTCGRTAAIQCQWFALCSNIATRTRSGVAICADCDEHLTAVFA